MTKKERARWVAAQLDTLFPDPPIPLVHKDAYTLLIAVLLSARCTDKMVNRITPSLFALADTPQKMAAMEVREIQKVIRPCGLSPQKAKAIQALSKILIEEYGGEVPSTFEELEALPGVGHKTASVVLSQAFDLPAFPIDTHIHRVAKRWGLSSGKNVKQTEKDLKALFPKEIWNRLHLQMIHYARAFCPALRHRVEECPLCNALNLK